MKTQPLLTDPKANVQRKNILFPWLDLSRDFKKFPSLVDRKNVNLLTFDDIQQG